MRSSNLWDNLEEFKRYAFEECIKLYDNDIGANHIPIGYTPGSIHCFKEEYPPQSFLYTNDMILDVCRQCIKYCDSLHIDDAGGFCQKEQKQKWLGHLLFFRSPDRKQAYFAGAIFTLDWTASHATKKFHKFCLYLIF